jgi:hypothetical protein
MSWPEALVTIVAMIIVAIITIFVIASIMMGKKKDE